jgi:N-acetylglucosaminyl-diphospho-decaprenol L-rhamnosyltransferase
VTLELGEVTAVVLNWRTPVQTIRSVRALVSDGVPAGRIVVVDNGSEDRSAERLAADLPASVVVALDENLGFGRGNNIGARALPGPAYLFVNSDAFVHRRGSTESLLAALDDPLVGLAVPRLLNEDLSLQRSVVPAAGPLPELVRASGLSRLIPNTLQPALGTHWDHGQSRTIQAATGAVVAVRADVWEGLGGFSEARFMYAEDLDLFWRARERGWRVRFVADAEFVHLSNTSARSRWTEPERAERVARAEAATIRNHMPPGRGTLTLTLMALGVGARGLVYRMRGDRSRAATMAAWLRGYGTGLWRSRPGRLSSGSHRANAGEDVQDPARGPFPRKPADGRRSAGA